MTLVPTAEAAVGPASRIAVRDGTLVVATERRLEWIDATSGQRRDVVAPDHRPGPLVPLLDGGLGWGALPVDGEPTPVLHGSLATVVDAALADEGIDGSRDASIVLGCVRPDGSATAFVTHVPRPRTRDRRATRIEFRLVVTALDATEPTVVVPLRDRVLDLAWNGDSVWAATAGDLLRVDGTGAVDRHGVVALAVASDGDGVVGGTADGRVVWTDPDEAVDGAHAARCTAVGSGNGIVVTGGEDAVIRRWRGRRPVDSVSVGEPVVALATGAHDGIVAALVGTGEQRRAVVLSEG